MADEAAPAARITTGAPPPGGAVRPPIAAIRNRSKIAEAKRRCGGTQALGTCNGSWKHFIRDWKQVTEESS